MHAQALIDVQTAAAAPQPPPREQTQQQQFQSQQFQQAGFEGGDGFQALPDAGSGWQLPIDGPPSGYSELFDANLNELSEEELQEVRTPQAPASC